MSFDLRTANLRAINSMTKYPSIPTYHTLDPADGGLLDETVPFAGDVVVTEKIDGTNSRIILLPDGTYLLGSREELLYAKGDLIGNPAQGIVDALRDVAEQLANSRVDAVVVLFLELYGGKVTAGSKHYTRDRKQVGWRLFDVAEIPDYAEMADWPTERISAWRDGGGQQFAPEKTLTDTLAPASGLPLVPRLSTMYAEDLSTDIAGMHRFLVENLPETTAALDGAEPGRAEGVVLRTPDRSLIAKARFQDYERTLKRRGVGQREKSAAPAGASA